MSTRTVNFVHIWFFQQAVSAVQRALNNSAASPLIVFHSSDMRCKLAALSWAHGCSFLASDSNIYGSRRRGVIQIRRFQMFFSNMPSTRFFNKAGFNYCPRSGPLHGMPVTNKNQPASKRVFCFFSCKTSRRSSLVGRARGFWKESFERCMLNWLALCEFSELS